MVDGHVCLATDSTGARYTDHVFGFSGDPWRGATILTEAVVKKLEATGETPLRMIVETCPRKEQKHG